MREKDELKMTVRHYRFVLLRIRFPDGIILQGIKIVTTHYKASWLGYMTFAGVFKPLETISDVRQFVSSSLEREECPFSLSAFSNVLSDDGVSIAQAGLVSII